MGYYKKQLENFEDTNFNLWEIIAAAVVLDGNFGFELNDNEFEVISNFVYAWIMNTSCQASELVEVIARLIKSGELTIKDLDENQQMAVNRINDEF